MRKTTLGLLFVTTAAAATLDAAPADACGGCFVPPSEATVVTDHRMALSISPQQTVLWDQIRYSGDPREFAWVLPIRAGAKIEVANDEFFSALDASTQPVISGPNRFGGAAGCGLTGCASDSLASAESAGPGSVQVLSQSVVGPYEQVTLRSTDDDALTAWLQKNDFSIPTEIQPTIEAYVREGFDFIALKLRPECGERSMRPVRVVTPGADPTLPLRMVAAGVGARVGITLYVIGEGRFEPQNFPSALIDDEDLRWDRYQNRSNYEDLSQSLMADASGRTWITEYADKPQLPVGRWTPGSSSTGSGRSGVIRTPGLADDYYGRCKLYRGSSVTNPSAPAPSGSSGTGSFTPCPQPTFDAGGNDNTLADASVDDAGDAGVDDAGLDDAGDDAGDASSGETYGDAGYQPPPEVDASTPPPSTEDCSYLDDLDLAIEGLHREDIWVTRLRAVLPVDALSVGDLRLQPSATQLAVSNYHWTPYYADEDSPQTSQKSSCAGAPKEHRTFGSWAMAAMTAIFAVSWWRRRRGRR